MIEIVLPGMMVVAARHPGELGGWRLKSPSRNEAAMPVSSAAPSVAAIERPETQWPARPRVRNATLRRHVLVRSAGKGFAPQGLR